MMPLPCFVDDFIEFSFVNFPSRAHEIRKRGCSSFSIQGEAFLDEFSNVPFRRHPKALSFARKLRHRPAGKTFDLKTCSISCHVADPSIHRFFARGSELYHAQKGAANKTWATYKALFF
jgi:hypothetical protein